MSGIPMGGGKNFSGIRTETFVDEKVTGPGFFYEKKMMGKFFTNLY